MFTSDVLAYYKGSRTEIAKALDITPQAVSQWKELVPPLSAAKLAKLTNGRLKFDPYQYDSHNVRGERSA